MKSSEILGYLGPNGAGKPTTIRMLAGLLESTDGSIYYSGKNIKDNLYEYKKRIGYVPEEVETIGCGCRQNHEKRPPP